ncbi:hypothetical protein BFJ70_g16579 [Fusarium oxysporum]|nr:hypothetical protein BFJ70_g16579 [Fusarium oxysporum]
MWRRRRDRLNEFPTDRTAGVVHKQRFQRAMIITVFVWTLRLRERVVPSDRSVKDFLSRRNGGTSSGRELGINERALREETAAGPPIGATARCCMLVTAYSGAQVGFWWRLWQPASQLDGATTGWGGGTLTKAGGAA